MRRVRDEASGTDGAGVGTKFPPAAELEANRRSDHFSVPAEFSPFVPCSTIDRSDLLAQIGGCPLLLIVTLERGDYRPS